jgi:hypothetical protein
MDNFARVSNKRFEEIKSKYSATGWFKEIDRAYANGTFSVVVRTIKTEYGLCKHAAIRNLDSTEVTWSEKQEIKNKIFGVNYVAIEVYPKQDELVDGANMYHLWILPLQYNLPFNLHKE